MGQPWRPASALGQRLASEGAAYTAVEVAQQALGLLAVPIVFSYLSPGDFGLVTWALVVSQLVMTIASGGLDFSLLRHHHQLGDQARAAQQSDALLRVVLLAVAIGALAPVAVRWAPPQERGPILLGVAAGLVLGMRALPVAVLRGEGRLGRYAVVQVGGTLCQVIVQLVLLPLGYGVSGYLWGYVVGGLSMLPVAFAGSGGGSWTRRSGPGDRTVIRYAASIFPTTLLNRAPLLADRALLVGWGGAEALGLYGAALRLATPAKLLSGGLKNALAPALARAEAEQVDRGEAAAPLARLVILSTLPLGAGIGLAGWCVQFTSWQSHWLGMQRILGLLLFAQVLQSLAFVLQTLVYYGPMPSRAGWIAGAQTATLVAALVVLVPLAQGAGAAASQLLAGLVAVSVAIWMIRRDHVFPHVTAAAVWPAIAFLPVVAALTLAGSGTQLATLLVCLAAYATVCGSAWRRLHAVRHKTAPA